MLTSLFTISLGAILVNNFIFSQFLGICPFMGVSKKMDTALGMGFAVTFVMGVASAVTWAVNEFLLVPFDLVYMQTIALSWSSHLWCSSLRCFCKRRSRLCIRRSVSICP